MTETTMQATAYRRLPAARWWPGLSVPVIGLAVYLADQQAKAVALAHLVPGAPVPVIGDWLTWRLVFNPGAAFSLGTSITPVFTIFQTAVSLTVLLLAWRLRSRWWAVAVGLVLGGATGNLHDRLLRPPGAGYGHVVDFISVGDFPVFNLADSAITAAAVMIAIAALLGREAFGSHAGAAPADAGTPGPGAPPGPDADPGAGAGADAGERHG